MTPGLSRSTSDKANLAEPVIHFGGLCFALTDRLAILAGPDCSPWRPRVVPDRALASSPGPFHAAGRAMSSSAPTSRHSGPSNRAAWAAQANTRPAGPTTSTPTTRWRRYSSRTAVGWSFPTCAAATAAAEGRAGWWYLSYFATERGRLGYRRHTDDLTKLIWQLASPTWDFDGATFDCTAASFANPDHVDIVIHN